MNNKKNLIISLILNSLIVVFSLMGIVFSFASDDFMNNSQWLYFTLQSNVWIFLICIIFVIYDIILIKNTDKKIPKFLYLTKYIFTVAISITFLIFLFVLTPQLIAQGNAWYLLTPSNLFLHFITPLLAIICFLYFENYKFKIIYFLCGTIMPLLYFIFIMILSLFPLAPFKQMDGTTSKFPYFFFDYITNGWFSINNGFFGLGVFYWVFIMCLFIIFISWMFLKIKSNIIKKNK